MNNIKPQFVGGSSLQVDISARHGKNDDQRLGQNEITKTFTLNFQVVVMEVNAHMFFSHSL